MSVVVRMEMPENCTCCPMCFTADVQGYHWCAALEQEVEEGLSRPKECPIICQLPEGHGRLVDAELVKEILKPVDSISHYEPEWTWGELHESNCVAIDNAPTIVPAEAQRKVNASDAVAPTDTPTDTPTVPAERSDT